MKKSRAAHPAIFGVIVILTSACGSGAAQSSGSLSGMATVSPVPSSAAPSVSPVRSTPLAAPVPTRPAAISSNATFSLLAARQPTGFKSPITCSGPIGPSDPVAVVRIGAAFETVLRDYATVSNPRSACRLGGPQDIPAQLIDARHVVIGTDAGVYAVVDLPTLRYHWFKLPTLPAKSSSFIAVSPKLDQVLWLASDLTKYEVHITTRAGDHLVATLPNQMNGICGSWGSSSGAYTRSGQHLFVLVQPHANALNSLLVLQGQTPLLSLIPPLAGWGPGANPTMAVWSPTADTLFYLRGGDVWKWTPGSKPQRFLADVSWSYPTITPDGNHLAYEVSGNVYLVDLARAGSPSPKLIGKGRIGPVFLNSSQLWETAPLGCTAPQPRNVIYDITTHTEAPSIIDNVFAVWPATSSNW